MNWYSTRVRLVIFVGPNPDCYADSVHLLLATDFKEAFQKALLVGQSQEREYLNGDNEPVRWRLKEIISLDSVIDGITDGCEVYSEPCPLADGDRTLREDDLRPADSSPTETF